jgi:triosephosphate isomerase
MNVIDHNALIFSLKLLQNDIKKLIILAEQIQPDENGAFTTNQSNYIIYKLNNLKDGMKHFMLNHGFEQEDYEKQLNEALRDSEEKNESVVESISKRSPEVDSPKQ